MDTLRSLPIQWTGGVTELLECKEGKQKKGESYWLNREDCEPTSVLDLGSRLSPPLECTCTNSGFIKSCADSHPNPFCPHAHVCWGNCHHDPATSIEMGVTNEPKTQFEVYTMEKEDISPFSEPASYSSDRILLDGWTMDDYIMADNDRDIDIIWAERQSGMMRRSTLPSQGFYGGSGSTAPCWRHTDDSYFAASMYGDSYPQNYMNYDKAIKGFSAAGEERMAAVELDIPVGRPPLETNICSPYGCSSEEDDLVDSFINIDSAEFCENVVAAAPVDYGRCNSINSIDSNAHSFGIESRNQNHHKQRDQDAASTISTCSNTSQLSSSLSSPSTLSNPVQPQDIQLEMSNMDNAPTERQIGQEAMTNGALAIRQDQGLVAVDNQDQEMADADDGLRLVHLLLACAEAVACRDNTLAASLLEQLKVSAHVSGDSMQRVTCCFAEGLAARLSSMSGVIRPEFRIPNRNERMEGLQLLYQCCPYLAFGFFAANEAILQAFEGKKQVHILDLGMVQKLQWPALIRALASRAEGPPHLRITAMGASIHELNEWGKELSVFAQSLKVPFEFTTAAESLESSLLTSSSLGLRDGETLAVNSVLQLHRMVKENRGSLKSVLHSLHRLSPAIITLVEQDANHNGPFFLGRFLEALYFYSAIFDSLEASLPRHSQQRLKVERFYFAEEIRNIVACEGLERVERHEKADQWRRQLSRAGFQAVPLKFMSQARMMLSLYSCDGYTLAEEKGCLLLGWKGKPIMLASAWKPCQTPVQ